MVYFIHRLFKTGDNDDGETNIALIAGAVAGGCVLLIFVVAVIIVYRR